MSNLINHVHTLITKGNKNDISNINVLIDDIIKQLVLHKNIHINQFYPVFIIYLDRLFGEDITIQYDNNATGSTSNTTASEASIWVKGAVGGWLKALVETNFEEYSQKSSSNNSIENATYRIDQNAYKGQYALKASYLDTISSTTQRLLKYFIPNTSQLLDLLNKSQSRFELKISMLPIKLQMYLIEHPVIIAFNSSNADQICHHLLSYPLHTILQVSKLYVCLSLRTNL